MELQTLDNELDEKYKKVENLIAKKTEESADARRKAEMLQNEAKTLLAQANSKLQLLKGRFFLTYFLRVYLKGKVPFTCLKHLEPYNKRTIHLWFLDHHSITAQTFYFYLPQI